MLELDWWAALVLTPALLWAKRHHIVYGVAFGLLLVAGVLLVEWMTATGPDDTFSQALKWLSTQLKAD